MQHWSYVSIFDEYRRFSNPKSRAMDLQFIELFETALVRLTPQYLPNWPEIENDVFLPSLVESHDNSPLKDSPTEADNDENTN
jgi:hypothetical protein